MSKGGFCGGSPLSIAGAVVLRAVAGLVGRPRCDRRRMPKRGLGALGGPHVGRVPFLCGGACRHSRQTPPHKNDTLPPSRPAGAVRTPVLAFEFYRGAGKFYR